MDNYRRKLFLKNEIKKHLLKGVIKNRNLAVTYRYLAYWHRSKIVVTGAHARHNDRCILTGRIWAINKHTKLSRFKFRTESYKGNLPGFSRASW